MSHQFPQSRNNTWTLSQIFKPSVGNVVPVRVQESGSSPTANLQTWEKGGGSIYAKFDSTGVLFLGLAGTQTGTIKMLGTTSGTVTIAPAAAAGTWSWTLPTTGGTNGYALTTNGSGVSTWGKVDEALAVKRPYVAKNANYTITTSDFIVDCTANTFTITLPTAVGTSGDAQRYVIKNSGTGVITIATTSAQTIDGGASGVLTLVQWDSLVVFSNNSNWLKE